jgi:hypothetical protein
VKAEKLRYVDSIIAQNTDKGVRISWRPVPDTENVIYKVYRSPDPLNNESGYPSATVIGEIKGTETFITDANPLKEEVYYGVTVFDNAENKEYRDLVFQKSFIAHKIPVKAEEPAGDPTENQTEPKISGILAVNSDKTVKISWIPAAKADIFYTVYRILRTGGNDTLESGEKLGFVPETTSNFEDISPVPDQEVFYAVTLTDRKTNMEIKTLEFKQSFINHIFVNKAKYDPAASKNRDNLPDTLMTYQKDARTIQLMWADPVAPVQKLAVYRSDRPITSADILNYASKLGTVNRNVNEFTDSNLEAGRYFYGLFPLDSDQKPLPLFEEGHTYTGFAVTIKEKPPQADLAALPDSSAVKPEPVKQTSPEEGLHSEEERTKIKKEREKLEQEKLEFEEWKLKQEKLIRLQLQKKKKENIYNYETDESINKQDHSSNPAQRKKLNDLLAQSYLQGSYGEAIRLLSIYMKTEKPDPENKARARLYMGMSFYNLKRFDEALVIFSSPEVRKIYPERAKFWMQRSVEMTEKQKQSYLN